MASSVFPSDASSASGGHCLHLQSALTLKISSELSYASCCCGTGQSRSKSGLVSSQWAAACAAQDKTMLSRYLASSPHRLLAALKTYVGGFCSIAEHR